MPQGRRHNAALKTCFSTRRCLEPMRGFEPRTYGLRNPDNSGQTRTQADSKSRLRVVDGAGQGQTRTEADASGSRVTSTPDVVAEALNKATSVRPRYALRFSM